ncbi:MAG: DUF3102 domain-containing protein [Planctomycetaceae bacterium]|nr:DUF3102 domain-containing protein [Planctomycetaceae bacterium]
MSNNLPEKLPFENDSAVSTIDLHAIADQINSSHRECESTARIMVEHAIAVGEGLLRAKELIGHGGFGSWLSENTKISDRQARRYMTLARELPARLTDEANRSRTSDLTIAGALRLIDEGDISPDSILRHPLVRRKELVLAWPDIRWSRFTSFEAAGYTPGEIASIFDLSQDEVATELDRLRSPQVPDRSDWLRANLGDVTDYESSIANDLIAQRAHIFGNAASSAERDLGKPQVAKRLRAQAADLFKSVCEIGSLNINEEACAHLCDRFGLESDGSSSRCVVIALHVCAMSDIRSALGLEASRPMDELFRESLALQVEIAAMARESAETGIAISEQDQRSRLDRIVRRLTAERSASSGA